MADLPPGFELESRGSFDPLKPLLSQGIEATNGFRTPGDIQRLKSEGYTPASNSDHLRGDAVDLVPGKSGLNLARLAAKAKEAFGPEASVGIHNGTHVHVSLKGWGQAPGTPGTPHSGLPPVPEGFEVEQRGSLKGQNLQPVDYSEMSPGGDAVEQTVAASGSTTHSVADPEAGHLVDSLVRQAVPYADAVAKVREQFPEYPAFSPDEYRAATQYHTEHPNYKGSFGAATRNLPLDPTAKANNDFVQSGTGALVGNFANGLTAGAPVALAGDEGIYWEGLANQQHPYASTVGNLAGNVAGAVLGGKAIGGIARGLDNPIAQAIVANPGKAQLGVDLAMGAGYGASENPNDRLHGALVGAGLTAALEGIGRSIVGPGLRVGRQVLGDAIENRTARQIVLPETEPLQEAAVNAASPDQQQAPSYAAMASDVPEVRSRDVMDVGSRPAVAPGTEEQRAVAAEVRPQDVVTTIEPVKEGVASEPAGMREAFPAGRFANVEPPNELESLGVRTVTTPQGGKVKIRGPLDVSQSIRLLGGVRDDGGELAHLGITNGPRDLPFGRNEQFLGPLVNPNGKSLDDLGERLWEEGYFKERPTPAELLDTLHAEAGGMRSFHPDDLGEVAEFERKARIRYTMQDEPLTEDKSVTAGPREFGPVEAPPLSKVAKAGNINLKNIETPEDIDALMRFTAGTFDGFKGERRGVQSWAQTEALAKDLGMTPDDLLARRTGEAMNAEQAHAARGILSASAAETRNLADKAITGSAEDKAAFVKSFLLHAAITEKAAGAAAEAGRALNIYRKVSKASLADREAMQDAIKRMQGGTNVEQIAEMVKQLGDDPAALNRFARDAIKPRFRDKLLFVWINSLLSGPKTHVVNMSSNLLTAAMGVPEHALAAGLGSLRRDHDRVLLSEIGPRFYGMIRGGAESLSMAKEAFAVADSGGKTDAVRPAIGGMAGKIISIPTRALNAEDAFFKGMARRSELAGLAVRKARTEGLRGEALATRIDQLVNHPTDEMMTAAVDAALYKTFQRPLGPAGQKLSKAIEAWGWPKLFVPFIRTPTNLLKYAVEHSPAAPMLKEVRTEFLAGGSRRDLAIARMTMGTGIGLSVAGLAGAGKITGGGPADPSAKRALEANGWQPYSFKIGDTYVSYRRLDPWATVLGMAADSVELQSAMTEKQQQDTGAVLIGALVQNLSSKTWLSGFSDLIDAVTDPQANAKNVLTRLGSSMVTPTLSAQAAQAIDPSFRDTNGAGYIDTLRKKIEARIPGLSQNVIPRRDIMGDEVKNELNPVGRFLSPFDVSTDLHDPNAKAILDSGARFSAPSRTMKGARLPDEMYDVYQSFAGQLTKQYLTTVRTAPDWATMDKSAKAKAIEKAKNRARKDARSALFAQ